MYIGLHQVTRIVVREAHDYGDPTLTGMCQHIELHDDKGCAVTIAAHLADGYTGIPAND